MTTPTPKKVSPYPQGTRAAAAPRRIQSQRQRRFSKPSGWLIVNPLFLTILHLGAFPMIAEKAGAGCFTSRLGRGLPDLPAHHAPPRQAVIASLPVRGLPEIEPEEHENGSS